MVKHYISVVPIHRVWWELTLQCYSTHSCRYFRLKPNLAPIVGQRLWRWPAIGAKLVLMFGHCPLRCENVHRWRVHLIFAQYSIPSTPQYPLSRQTTLAPHFSVPFCFLFGLTAWIGHTPRAQISHTVAKINLFRSVYKCCIWLNPCGTEAYTKHINPLPGAVEH